MPHGGLQESITTALATIVTRQLQAVREKKLTGDLSSAEELDLLRSLRDVEFALAGITKSLDLYSPLGSNPEEPYGSRAWYQTGRKGRNSGFVSMYNVCNDEFEPDTDDHRSVLDKIDHDAELSMGYDLWPDEFHHPAKVEIRVDPQSRIEFKYIPEIETAKSRHFSHSEVSDEKGVRVYEESALSIRIDLDPKAPNGIALDLGRSPYEGGRNGRNLTRTGDLVGLVLMSDDRTGSHEYTGFDDESAQKFRNFAERFAVQLDLQKKEFILGSRRGSLAEVALRATSKSAA